MLLAELGAAVTDWRLIQDDGAEAAEGLAIDEALMLPYGRDRPAGSHAATLRLYTYRPHCALIGRYQMLAAEVDLDACSRLAIGVGRRPTGGGAIIMGPGQLGVAVTTRAPTGIPPRDLLRRFAGGIIAGLATLGIDAGFRGKNDLEVGGRKIAGLGLYIDDHGGLLFHASVLVDLDIALMLQVLQIPGAKLADKGLGRVRERITTVSEQLGDATSTDRVRGLVADGFCSTLGLDLTLAQPAAAERARAAALTRDRYASSAWVHGEQPTGDARGSFALKTPAGLVRVYAGVQRDALSSVMFTGDFSTMPPELLALEAALRWCRADPERITEATRGELAADALGIGPDAIGAAIWGAAERALARAGVAEPVRPQGSCYFPEPVVNVSQVAVR